MRDGTVETVSRDQTLRHERGQGNINLPCSADHEQDWQPYAVDPYSCYVCDHTRGGRSYPAEFSQHIPRNDEWNFLLFFSRKFVFSFIYF